eukprot:14212893-Ditylum_brightwellii.AAC.1
MWCIRTTRAACDRIAAGELMVEYCPTNTMVGDFYTKPLQGKLFQVFRNRVLNLSDDPCVQAARKNILEHQSQIAHAPRQDSRTQECVGHHGNEIGTTKIVPSPTRLTEHISTTTAYRGNGKLFPARHFM